MKITEDVRKYAAEQGIAEEEMMSANLPSSHQAIRRIIHDIFLENLLKALRIEVFVLKDYLSQKLKTEFRPRTEKDVN